MSNRIKVIVNGACGRMGTETVKAVSAVEDMELVGVCDVTNVGVSFADVTGVSAGDLSINDDLAGLIGDTRPDAVVDFTSPTSVMANARTILEAGVPAIIGTTGITPDGLKELEELANSKSTSVIVAPNFAVGAVLMMKFAAEAAKHMATAEIIELHHDKKLDSPSGTALKTAEMISAAKGTDGVQQTGGGPGREFEYQNVRVHSVRLPGLVAHQEVVFGGQGQTLTIRHDSIDRTSFMPGVLLAIRKSQQVKGLIYGLEKLL